MVTATSAQAVEEARRKGAGEVEERLERLRVEHDRLRRENAKYVSLTSLHSIAQH